MVKLQDVIEQRKNVVKSVRVTQVNDNFLKEHKINLGKVVDVSIEELKNKMRKESGAWK